jgi:hypothetical protein
MNDTRLRLEITDAGGTVVTPYDDLDSAISHAQRYHTLAGRSPAEYAGICRLEPDAPAFTVDGVTRYAITTICANCNVRLIDCACMYGPARGADFMAGALTGECPSCHQQSPYNEVCPNCRAEERRPQGSQDALFNGNAFRPQITGQQAWSLGACGFEG